MVMSQNLKPEDNDMIMTHILNPNDNMIMTQNLKPKDTDNIS